MDFQACGCCPLDELGVVAQHAICEERGQMIL